MGQGQTPWAEGHSRLACKRERRWRTGEGRGAVIKLFEPFGRIARFDYMWHTHGPRRGEPRGFCFVEYKRHEVRATPATSGGQRLVSS